MAEPAWKSFPLHATGIQVFVSKSGSDSNDGLSSGSPKLTIAAGYALVNNGTRPGLPDQLLLNRGDTWTGESLGAENEKGGLSEDYPFLIGSYGTGARPRIVDQGFVMSRFTSNVPYLAVCDLDMERVTDGAAGADVGLNFVGYGGTVHVQNCKLTGFVDNLIIQARGGNIDKVTLRGNLILDSYNSTLGGRGSGMFLGGVSGEYLLKVDADHLFLDHNGWHADQVTYPNATKDRKAHNWYSTVYAQNMTATDIVTCRSSATGVQFRWGGQIDNVLSVQNPVGVLVGHDESAWPSQAGVGTAQNIVHIGGDNIGIEGNRGTGLVAMRTSGVTIQKCIVAHNVNGDQPSPIWVENYNTGLVFDDVIVYDMVVGDEAFQGQGGIYLNPAGLSPFDMTFQDMQIDVLATPGWSVDMHIDFATLGTVAFGPNNRYFNVTAHTKVFRDLFGTGELASNAAWVALTGETGATFTADTYTDPTRDVASYMTSIGEVGTEDEFYRLSRLQEQGSWDDRLDASSVNAWIQAGFDQTPAPPLGAYVPPVNNSRRTFMFMLNGVGIPVVTEAP